MASALKFTFRQMRNVVTIYVNKLEADKKVFQASNLHAYPHQDKLTVLKELVILLTNLEYTGTIDGQGTPAPAPQARLFAD